MSKISIRLVGLSNFIGWGGIICGAIFCFIDFFIGSILLFTISFVLWLFNILILFKQKTAREILYLNLICGSLMISSSILAQIALVILTIDHSFLQYFLITFPFFLGGFLIADSIRFYRRRDRIAPEEPASTFSTKHFYAIFLCISVFGIAIYILLITGDVLILAVFSIVAFVSIVSINYLLRRYFRNSSSTIDEQFKDKIKPFVMMGALSVASVFIIIFILFLSGVAIPYNILGASLLSLLGIFMALYFILKYFYFPEKLK
jgi:hypothetical protein